MPIFNASSLKLNKNTGNLPNLSVGLLNWFQPMIFNLLTKSTIDFVLTETSDEVTFKGVWQAYTHQQLSILPEGQRAWIWFTLHAEVALILTVDQEIEYEGTKYRVMQKIDHQRYGFVEYHLCQGYENATP